MNRNNTPISLIWCVWLFPLASIKFFSFGWPLYPIEAVLLAMFPFFPFREYWLSWRQTIVRGAAIFSVALLLGVVSSYLVNPKTLIGLGQIKSFFLFPILFALFLIPVLRERNKREELFQQLRLMMAMTALLALLSAFFGGITYDHRLAAWFDSPNLLALFLLPGGVLWWARVTTSNHVSWRNIFLWGVVTGAIFWTRSYGVILALSLSNGYFFLRYHGQRSGIRREIVLVGIIFLVVFGSLERGTEKWEALTSWSERSSGESRMMIWKSAGEMIRLNPIFGIGPGRFQETYLSYQKFYPPYLEWSAPHPHNFFLSLWLSAGALGAGAFFWFALFLVRTFRQSVSIGKEKTLITALFISFFVAGFFDVPFFRFEFCALFWIYVSLFIAVYSEAKGTLAS